MSSVNNEIVIGLINIDNKYLTAEKFGNQINVTGNALRSKQMWTFEKISESNKGYLKSNQGKYLETDKNGVVTCRDTEKDEAFLFNVEITDDGCWAFVDSFGKYFAGNSERLYTTFKMEKYSSWRVQFTIHPHCNLKSIARKRFVYLNENELYANEDIPWGDSAIITLSFVKSRYAIQDCRGRYFNGGTGEMQSECDDNQCLFNLSLQNGGFVFQCSNKKYLTIHGPQGRLIATKENISRDELFEIEECKVQVILTANNGKMTSTKQSIDVKASQHIDVAPIEDTEIFQLEYLDVNTNRVTLQTRNKAYWEASEKSITASATAINENCIFQFENHKGKVALKAFNNKYIASTSGGALAPTSDGYDSNALFTLTLANRSKILLRGVHGYMGLCNGRKVQCNLGNAEIMKLENANDGKYEIRTVNDLALKVDSDLSIIISPPPGDVFSIELHGKNRLQIKASNGQYLVGNQNGSMIAGGDEGNNNTI